MATVTLTASQKRIALVALMRVMSYNKSWAELARRLSKVGPGDVDRQTVWNWYHRDKRVPAEWVHAVVAVSAGLTSKEELRPDIYRAEETVDDE